MLETCEKVRRGFSLFNCEIISIDLIYKRHKEQIAQIKPDICFIVDPYFYDKGKNVQDIRMWLDTHNYKYTGSSPAVAKICKDKILSKEYFVQLGVKTPKHVLAPENIDLLFLEESCDILGFPLIVKPRYEGAGVGVNLCKEFSELNIVIPKLRKLFPEVFLEEYIDGIDVTVGVMGGGAKAQALIPVEVELLGAPIYDYDTKQGERYVKHKPARLSMYLLDEIRRCAKKIHEGIGCAGITRSDYRIVNQEIYCIEINGSPMGSWRDYLVTQQEMGMFPGLDKRIDSYQDILKEISNDAVSDVL